MDKNGDGIIDYQEFMPVCFSMIVEILSDKVGRRRLCPTTIEADHIFAIFLFMNFGFFLHPISLESRFGRFFSPFFSFFVCREDTIFFIRAALFFLHIKNQFFFFAFLWSVPKKK